MLCVVRRQLYDSRVANERSTLEACLKEVLEFQETRQRALLVSWTAVIDALDPVVDAELKLVKRSACVARWPLRFFFSLSSELLRSNERWRTESIRPVTASLPDAAVRDGGGGGGGAWR